MRYRLTTRWASFSKFYEQNPIKCIHKNLFIQFSIPLQLEKIIKSNVLNYQMLTIRRNNKTSYIL